MNELQQVLFKYHSLPFHYWISNNTPIHALKTQAHKMLWHQQLIHLSPATLQSAYKYCDGIPNLSNFAFDDADKQDVTHTVNLKAKDDSFEIQLASDNLSGRTYVKEVTDSVSSTNTKAFKTLETSRNCLCGVYITHINNVPVFSTGQAKTQLQMLYEQFKK